MLYFSAYLLILLILLVPKSGSSYTSTSPPITDWTTSADANAEITTGKSRAEETETSQASDQNDASLGLFNPAVNTDTHTRVAPISLLRQMLMLQLLIRSPMAYLAWKRIVG
jgi:hypothetical protein